MKVHEMDWEVTDREDAILHQIADRVMELDLVRSGEVEYDKVTCMMDLIACHKYSTQLDLNKLLHADKATFGHDVFGIRKHMNRDTGLIEDCFVPRCAL